MVKRLSVLVMALSASVYAQIDVRPVTQGIALTSCETGERIDGVSLSTRIDTAMRKAMTVEPLPEAGESDSICGVQEYRFDRTNLATPPAGPDPVDPDPVEPDPVDSGAWAPPPWPPLDNPDALYPDDPMDYLEPGKNRYHGPIPPAPDPVQTRTTPAPVGGINLEFAGATAIPDRSDDGFKVGRGIGALAYDDGLLWVSGVDLKVCAFRPTWEMVTDPNALVRGKWAVPSMTTDNAESADWNQRRSVTSLKVIEGKLWVGLTDYYDANGDNFRTHVVIDPSTGDVSPYRYMEGAARVSGWLQPVPAEWQDRLGGPWLAGHADNQPIAHRGSQGPTLYIWDGQENRDIPTQELMSYNLNHPLATDRYNNNTDGDIATRSKIPTQVGSNDLWTVESEARIGFILDDKYVVFGRQGMRDSSGGYKIIKKDGRRFQGPHAWENDDYQNYFWQYDLNHILEQSEPWSARPEKWGELVDLGVQLNAPPSQTGNTFGGADWDGKYLYIAIDDADTRNRFGGKPIVVRYRVTLEP